MQLTYEKVKYGMLVEVIHDDGYHSGCKVHFFNRKGVLVGNYYEFLPYEKLRVRQNINGANRQFPRYFYGKSLEKAKMLLFSFFLWLTGDSLKRKWTKKLTPN